MDLDKLIQEFLHERERLDQVIHYFENRLGGPETDKPGKPNQTPKPGVIRKRRKMTAAERNAVSERMRRYWSNRKKPGV